MTTMFFIQVALIMNYCNNPKQGYNATNNPNSYYQGSDKLFTNVWVKINGDTAIVDFIFWQKFPRELLTDTLRYYTCKHEWLGRISNLYQIGDKYYIRIIDELSIFYSKKEIRIKPIKEVNYNESDEYKNLAVKYMCYESYLSKGVNKEVDRKKFLELAKRYNLSKFQKHADYLREIEKLKSELKMQ